MRAKLLRCPTVIIVVVLSACRPERIPKNRAPASVASTAGLPNEACPRSRWISNSPDCGPNVKGRGGYWRRGLERGLCASEWIATSNRGSKGPDETALPPVGGDRWMERDCHIVGPAAVSLGANMTPSVSDSLAARLRNRFLRELDCPLPPATLYPTATIPPSKSEFETKWTVCFEGKAVGSEFIKAAVVDSSGDFDKSRSNHGTMVFQTIAATGSNGALKFANYIALPRSNMGGQVLIFQDDLGGHFGSLEELRRALHDVRSDMGAAPNSDGPRRWVINLSLGWSAAYGGAVDSGGNLQDEILGILEELSCRGALVIAAAGNQSADPVAGPLYPAGWEVRQNSKCRAALGPIVHAVAGVGWDGRVLALSRRGSIPRLAAAGAGFATSRDASQHHDIRSSTVAPDGTVQADALSSINAPTIAPGSDFGQGGAVYSGTSVAAAATSGVAALIWSLRPDLKAHEIMQILYDSGRPLDHYADFGFGGKPKATRVHAISVCGALRRACEKTAAACSSLWPALNARCPRNLKLPWPELLPELVVSGPMTSGPITMGLPGGPAPVALRDEPWNNAQPGSSRCPAGCLLSGSGVFNALVQPIEGEHLQQMETVVQRPAGTTSRIRVELPTGAGWFHHNLELPNAAGGIVQFIDNNGHIVSTEELLVIN